ncbi:ParB/RepB/Spo0J family partition protein [Roseiterribacter gracilis]|uniref:Chromosome partitioning protein ParB n=1 Tax=Roseiterribacter gracilis TaxID=2812848 RepID=A0A8S8XHR1_9PROT|nr:chromosome partitioning protein ParB [Rhodospirillales bacterium TMPK1]
MADPKKKGLGRGLSALLGDAQTAYAAASGTPGVPVDIATAVGGAQQTMPITWLTAGKYQPRRRFDDEAIAELAASIKTRGILQPILVRPLGQDKYEIVAGERRWRAAQKAGLHDVPVLVQQLADDAAAEIALVENLQRQDLSPLEEAQGYQRLIDEFGHSHSALGDTIGKSRSHVANTLRLLALPDAVKALLDDGKLMAGHARALLTAADPIALAREVVAKGLSVRATEQLAAKSKQAARPGTLGAPRASKSADLISLERDLTGRLGLNVSIETEGKGGKVTIEYKSMEQLDDLLARLTGGN